MNLENKKFNSLPIAISKEWVAIQSSIFSLKEAAAKIGVNREFTADGRLVGDLGELIAKCCYGINLTNKQKNGHDGTVFIDGKEYTVEIKCRSKSSLIGFSMSNPPDLVLVLFLCAKTNEWTEVYNGPFTYIKNGAKMKATKKCDINLSRLEKITLPKDTLKVPLTNYV